MDKKDPRVVIATPELLSEMESLMIYGGNSVPTDGTNDVHVYCDAAKCVECKSPNPPKGTSCVVVHIYCGNAVCG